MSHRLIIKALAFSAACRSAGLNTRLVASFYPIPISLASKCNIDPVYYWSEVFLPDEDKWVSVDTFTKFGVSLP